MRRIATLGVSLALLMTAALAAATHQYLEYEVDEPDRASLAGKGQRNNLPSVAGVNTTILDGLWGVSPLGVGLSPDAGASSGYGVFSPGTCVQSAGGQLPTCLRFDPTNIRRSTGVASDVMLPGAGQYYAWYGNWTDADEDGIIDRSRADNTIDFWSIPGGKLFSFVEPGSHPTFDSNTRPNSTRYDFSYTFGTPYFAGQNYFVWSHDGSLLRDVVVTTLANPVLEPAPNGLPFKCGDACLEDIDVYPALVGDPIRTIYSTIVGPVVDNALPTVGFSSTTVPPTLAPFVAPVLALVNSNPATPYLDARLAPTNENETRAANGSSIGARGVEAYATGYHVYFNAAIRYLVNGVAVTSDRVALANAAGTGPAAAPGWLSVRASLGVWKDLNNNTVANTGEFIGGCMPGRDRPNNDRANINYSLMPVGTWGTAPILEYRFNADSNGGGLAPTGRVFTGSDRIDAFMYCYKPDEGNGAHVSNYFYFFPTGAPAFRLLVGSESSPAGSFTHSSSGTTETFWDQDSYVGFL